MRLKIPRKNEVGGKKLSGIVAPHDVSFQKKIGSFKNDDLFFSKYNSYFEISKSNQMKKVEFFKSLIKALKIYDL